MVTTDAVDVRKLDKVPTRVLGLLKHVDVRWSSMYGMLVRFLRLKIAIKMYMVRAALLLLLKTRRLGLN